MAYIYTPELEKEYPLKHVIILMLPDVVILSTLLSSLTNQRDYPVHFVHFVHNV